MRLIHLLKWDRYIIVGLIFYCTTVTAVFASSSESATPSEPPPYSAHELLIQFKKNTHINIFLNFQNTGFAQLDSLNSMFGLQSILPFPAHSSTRRVESSFYFENAFLFSFENVTKLSEIQKAYRSMDIVEFAEPNYYYFSDTTKSNIMSPLEQCQIEQAESRNQSEKPVIIGIIDTGIDWKNSDLVGKLWNNSLEKQDGKDNDLNGFTDDIAGWDFTTSEKIQIRPDDSCGHGTHIAETISRIAHQFSTSSSPNHQLMILKAGSLTRDGLIRFSTFDVSRAIIYAAENGADVLNLSWYSEYPSEILRQAIAHAQSLGCCVIGSAGNENSDAPYYPAAFEEVWSVTAVDDNDDKFPDANHGDWVDVSAPGFGLFSASKNDTIISNFAGTSVAAAYVSGLAARLLSCEDINSSDSLKHRILWSCENIYKTNPDHEGKLGAGRINVMRAINAIHRPNIIVQNVSIEKEVPVQSLVSPEMYAVKIFLKNCSSFAENVKITLTAENPGITIVNPGIHIWKLDYQQEFDNQLSPFLIMPSQNFQDENTIHLKLIVEAANNYQFTKDISIQTELKPPKNLTINARRPVHLTWASSERFDLYNVYRKNSQEPVFQKLTNEPIPDNVFFDPGTVPGNHYFYYVTGIDNNGLESPPTKTVSISLPALSEFTFFPQTDTVFFSPDSLRFSCSNFDTVQDSYSFSWRVNGIEAGCEDSSFLFIPSQSASDSITKIVLKITSFALDTSLAHEWTLIHPKSEIDFSFDFFPVNDTTISCGDSILLRINPFQNNFVYQWFVNDSLDSLFSGNHFIFTAPGDSSGAARISAQITYEDTSASFFWNISYLLPPPPILLPTFSPASDTTIFEGDSILFTANFPFQLDQDMKIEWAVNGNRDSSFQSTSFLYFTDYASSGLDSVTLKLDLGDSLFSHVWLITVLNRNRAPQVFSASTLTDSSFVPGDTLSFFISAGDPDLDSLRYTWSLNQKTIESITDSTYSFIVTETKFSADTFVVKISDADTSIEHLWIVKYENRPTESPGVFSFFPSPDSLLMKPDSIQFEVWMENTETDSLFFQWFINSRLDTSAHDSAYSYVPSDSTPGNDTIRVAITGSDTLLSNEWIVLAHVPSVDSAQALHFVWFPAQDSVFMESDSITFGITNCKNGTDFLWLVNQRMDSSATDSIFIFFAEQSNDLNDTVRVVFFIEDSLHSREWYIFQPQPQAKKTPLLFHFSPAENNLTYIGADSLKLSVKIEDGMSESLTYQWFVNLKPDSTATDTTFYYLPENSTARSDTISVVVSNADTTIRRQWFIEVSPYVVVPAPQLIFPIEGNYISEENTFLWENDSSLKSLNLDRQGIFVIQLSYDSTFTKIISSDTCAAASIALNELSVFSQLLFSQPIYWQVRILFDFSTFSEFVHSPRPFYFLPLFSKLENFTGQKNENGSITLLWSTLYEDNCAGFNVYRSEFQNDNFDQINDNLITGQRQYSFQDGTTLAGEIYYYKLEEITNNGLSKFHETISITAPTPEKYSLSQNFPNPFNMKTSFKYQIPTSQHVLIEVYNVLGRKLKTLVDERKESGFYTVFWNGIDDKGENVVSGIYFYHISANGFHTTRKMIIVR